MKKFFFTLCFLFCAIIANAQEHLSFKGIPIEGSITTFCQKLKSKGFSQVSIDKNIVYLEGNFTGRQASVGVVADDNGQDVFMVVVLFEESDSWNTLVSAYEYYKDLYTEKYGTPKQCVENNPSPSDSNFILMDQLYQGRVTYSCTFEAPGGEINISIENNARRSGYLMIKYQDAQNLSVKRQSDLDEI